MPNIIYDFPEIAKRLPNGRRFGSIDDKKTDAQENITSEEVGIKSKLQKRIKKNDPF